IYGELPRNKTKSFKFINWGLELSALKFDTRITKTSEKAFATNLAKSSQQLGMISRKVSELQEIHRSLCHPGISRLQTYVKQNGLKFTRGEIEQVVRDCLVCAKLKPVFHRPRSRPLVKATRPFERISIDFKGPLPKAKGTGNLYILTVVDVSSRFPWAYATKDQSAESVIECLEDLFTMGGAPQTIHSDQGASFLSKKVKDFLKSYGVHSAKTTPYNPRANGQCEKMNATIWTAVQAKLADLNLTEGMWESVLPDALSSIRALASTSTGETPHNLLFNFKRNNAHVLPPKIPEWMQEPGPVLLKNFTRASKREPKVVDVDLVNSSPNYAWIKHPDGREQTINTRYLARRPRNKPVLKLEEEQISNSFPQLRISDSERFQELDANGNPLNKKGANHPEIPAQIKVEPQDRWEDHTIALCDSDQEFLQDFGCKYS
ncbi:MAG: transposase family protein, partial [Candidatus Poseidoniia archaeon]|nr:transposase family protein [Candidatus Poseidoniia archaeon]